MATEVKEVNLDEQFVFSAKVKKNIFILLVIGIISLVIGLISVSSSGGDHHSSNIENISSIASVDGIQAVEAKGHTYHWTTRLFANLWINNVFFTGLALIGVFFFAIQYVANAGWSAAIVRIMGALWRFLPITAVLTIGTFLLANHDLFHWTHDYLYDTSDPRYDSIIAGKQGFLNFPFYIGRMLLFFAVWIFFAWALRREHLKEDVEGGTNTFRKLVKMSAAFLIFFGVSSSVSAWDWVMSIDTHWFSTMFGWYVFASWFVSGLSVITLFIIILKDLGYLQVVNENHLHDMGKFIFGFSIFWTYIWFSQYLLIYYANIPEETIYFVDRLASDHYGKIIFINLIMNFFFPFLVLMTRDSKRKMIFLKIVCIVVIIGHWSDFYLMITPGTLKEHGGFGFLEIGLALIYASGFAYMFFDTISRSPLIAKNHPMIQESIYHTT